MLPALQGNLMRSPRLEVQERSDSNGEPDRRAGLTGTCRLAGHGLSGRVFAGEELPVVAAEEEGEAVEVGAELV
jgi:hypothetical protein